MNEKLRGQLAGAKELIRRGQSPHRGNFWLNSEYGRFFLPDMAAAYQFSPDYEPDVKRIVDDLKGGLFVDVGANIGLYSVMAAKNGCQVKAFEPSPYIYEYLKSNISANAVFQRVRAYPFAAWSSYAMLRFENYGHSGMGKVGDDGVPVKAVPLGEFIKDAPSLVKIDAEFSEPHVLRGFHPSCPVIFEAADEKHLEMCEKALGRKAEPLSDRRNYYAP